MWGLEGMDVGGQQVLTEEGKHQRGQGARKRPERGEWTSHLSQLATKLLKEAQGEDCDG